MIELEQLKKMHKAYDLLRDHPEFIHEDQKIYEETMKKVIEDLIYMREKFHIEEISEEDQKFIEGFHVGDWNRLSLRVEENGDISLIKDENTFIAHIYELFENLSVGTHSFEMLIK